MILLSIFQTCRFNGVNVMKFLLSGKTDLASIIGDEETGCISLIVNGLVVS